MGASFDDEFDDVGVAAQRLSASGNAAVRSAALRGSFGPVVDRHE
jgi:hypothetical protein